MGNFILLQLLGVNNRWLLLFACLGQFVAFAAGFNPHVDSFETLNYRPVLDRRKRSDDGERLSPLNLRFFSHGRPFHLILHRIDPEEDVFAKGFIIDVDGQHVDNQQRVHEILYRGHVEGDSLSRVYGSIIDGIFDGHIVLGDGRSFTVEKSTRYYSSEKRAPHYHSFIYADDRINHRKYARAKRKVVDHNVNVFNDDDVNRTSDSDSYGCGLNNELYRKMQHTQAAAMPLEDADFAIWPGRGRSALAALMDDDLDANNVPFSFRNQANFTRVRREIPRTRNEFKDVNGRRLYGVRTCTMYLQADHKLYDAIFFKEGNQNHIRTREEIVSLFYNHVKAVNQIYESTDFGGVQGLNFVIQRTSIYTKDTCLNGKPVPGSDNPFCEDNVDVSNYLNLNSQRNHSAFCLAYALTFRDFTGGTLGLAWVASPTFSTAGGICQMYQKYNEGQHGTAYRSLNTGIVTLVNYGNRVPLRVSQLTMAHEIGHNFGAPHDQTLECQPGLPDGNYIMFASATSGDKVNNAKFSRCSVSSISQVLYEVLQQPPADAHHLVMPLFGKKRNCFQERTSAFCGNQIHEPGEECDCGFSQRDCNEMGDRCCAPRESANGCKRTSGSKCSPSEGLCCNSESCSFYRAAERQLCRTESECLYSQLCNGTSAACPESAPKPDGLPCQDVTKVCHAGSCNGSICEEVGLKDCFLTEGKPSQLCHLACEKNGTCYSSFELAEFAAGKFKQKGRENQSGLLLHPGSPCNNYKGYCDILRKCRSVDSNGPLARLKNLLFNKHTIKTVSQWVQEHWWACVIMGIGLLLFMALFVKCCAVHTPSTNPNKLPAQNLSDTLRHPGTLLRRGRSNGPHRTAAYSVGPNNGAVAMTRANPNVSGQSNLRAGAPRNGPAANTDGHSRHRAHRERKQRHKQRHSGDERAAPSANSSQNRRNEQNSSGAGRSHHMHQHGAGNRAQPNMSAPPLIPPPPSSFDSVIIPPSQVFSPIHEPPPPYTPTDPANSVVPASSSAPIPSTSNGATTAHNDKDSSAKDRDNNASAARQSASTTALLGGVVTPVQLPSAPPQQPPQASGISSPVPLVPGPPLPGQGPRPGRRRPKPTDETTAKKASTTKPTNKRAAK